MIGKFIPAGGLVWATFLVMTVAGHKDDEMTLVIEPPALVVKYGDPANATCHASFNATMMGWETRVQPSSEVNTQQLFWNVDSATDWSLNDGIMCFANFDIYQINASLPITIYKIPVKVTISLVNPEGPLVEEQDYVLECVLEDVAPFQNLTVIWYREHTEIKRTDVPPMKKNDTVRDHLNFTASRDTNGAAYSCAAHLNVKIKDPVPDTTSGAHYLDVHYKPRVDISSLNLSLTEGESLELNCTSDGNPRPAYVWKHNSKTLDGETRRTLIIESIEMHADGSYECIASNTLGRSSITFTVSVWRNHLPWIAILVAIAIGVLLVVITAIYCSYHKKNKTGAYFLTKFKVGTRQNGQVAQANGYS